MSGVMGPPQYLLSAITKPASSQKARRWQSFQFKTILEATFVSQKFDKSFEHFQNKTSKDNCYLLRTPSQIQYAPPSPPPPLPMIPIVTGTYTGRKKKKKKETLISEMRITCGWRGEEGGDPASPRISKNRVEWSNGTRRENWEKMFPLSSGGQAVP